MPLIVTMTRTVCVCMCLVFLSVCVLYVVHFVVRTFCSLELELPVGEATSIKKTWTQLTRDKIKSAMRGHFVSSNPRSDFAIGAHLFRFHRKNSYRGRRRVGRFYFLSCNCVVLPYTPKFGLGSLSLSLFDVCHSDYEASE